MRLLFVIGLILLSFTSQAEILGVVCDEKSRITFEYDSLYEKLTLKREMANSAIKSTTSPVIDKYEMDHLDSLVYYILKGRVKDLKYGEFLRTPNAEYILADSDSGVFYVFEKTGPDSYVTFGSSKQCRERLNPFSRLIDAYDLPISTLVKLEKKFQYTNSEHSNTATSKVFSNGNSKVDTCTFEKDGRNVAPLTPGQTFEVASIERNYWQASPSKKLVEIKLKFEKFGALSCLSQFNVPTLTIGDLFDILRKHGVTLSLPNYIPQDLASDALKFRPSFRLINPVEIKAGTKKTKIGRSYGRVEGCNYNIPEVATEGQVITSLGSVISVKDIVNSYRGSDGREIEYSGVDIQFSDGGNLFCYAFDHITKPLFVHDILRALNFDNPNILVDL